MASWILLDVCDLILDRTERLGPTALHRAEKPLVCPLQSTVYHTVQALVTAAAATYRPTPATLLASLRWPPSMVLAGASRPTVTATETAILAGASPTVTAILDRDRP